MRQSGNTATQGVTAVFSASAQSGMTSFVTILNSHWKKCLPPCSSWSLLNTSTALLRRPRADSRSPVLIICKPLWLKASWSFSMSRTFVENLLWCLKTVFLWVRGKLHQPGFDSLHILFDVLFPEHHSHIPRVVDETLLVLCRFYERQFPETLMCTKMPHPTFCLSSCI